MFKDTTDGATHFNPVAESKARYEDYIKEAQEIIIRCRNGSMDNKQFEATVEHNISTLLTEARKKWLEEEIKHVQELTNLTMPHPRMGHIYEETISRVDVISRLEAELKAL